MKALILAAGYGTRFIRDLGAHQEAYPHLVGIPKPLLPIGDLPLVSHWMKMLETCDKVTNVYVVVSSYVQDGDLSHRPDSLWEKGLAYCQKQ